MMEVIDKHRSTNLHAQPAGIQVVLQAMSDLAAQGNIPANSQSSDEWLNEGSHSIT